MKPRIIVCGLGRTGYRIFCLLRQQGAAVVGISDRPLPGEGDDLVIGDLRAPCTLLAARIQDADTLVLTANDDALNLAILTRARVFNPRIRIVNRLLNDSLGDRLDHTLPLHVSLSVSALAGPMFGFAAQGNRVIGQLQLFNQTWPIHEEYINETHPWIGKQLSELWENASRMLIYYLPARDGVDLISAMDQGRRLQLGDRLIMGSKPHIRNRRRSRLRKFFKVLTNLRRFQQHGQSILMVTLVLLLTILMATVTYISVNLDTSIVDALYFSVGMITGAGGQEQVAEKAPATIKVFTAVMMIVGAGVIGICYALLNDFILGTRFHQFWDAARVPNRHHYIICGLGGIGVEIVNQLHSQGHEVVVIEQDPNNRFLGTARSWGIPVILGDPSLATTLQAVNVKSCEALLAVTHNDMVNVETALCAKSLAPKLPVVVRNHDPQLARTVQEVFDFEVVLSPTELATPSFAAAALGGRVVGHGMTSGMFWIALATLITPNHPFCGRRVKDAAMTADFVPLYVETNHQIIKGWEILDTCLSGGDVLYLIMPASGLELLWRAAPSQLIIS
ncbi:MAG: potassium channel protein [Symploca sp. SIO3C6]|nr:potassium channel protein [Symploca sp. SIO3C6]NET07457.1 potassium channel protein [Symploca sp. SIO2B6]NET50335.1 potassium channel protein [Merismopedia sp. SIO2A8]